MPEVANRSFLKVVAKTFAVVDALAQTESGARITELSRKLKQPKATVFRILFTLQKLGYTEKNQSTEAYQLTDQMEVFTRHGIRRTLRRTARPFLERLLGRFEQTVNLGVLDQDQILYVEILEGLRSIRMAATVSTYAPIHSTALGKAILAYLDVSQAERLLKERPLTRFTPKTLTSLPFLLNHLKKVRQRGYAVDNEETEVGARCVAATIFDSLGRPFAGISVSGPTSHMKTGQLEEVATAVREACRKISRQMGVVSAPVARPRPVSADCLP
jgi:IclR family transcriptional regulator, KDG regulon repressor